MKTEKLTVGTANEIVEYIENNLSKFAEKPVAMTVEQVVDYFVINNNGYFAIPKVDSTKHYFKVNSNTKNDFTKLYIGNKYGK